MRHHQWVRIASRLLLLLLLPVLGFGAVKGYYWYQVRAVVEQFTQQLSGLVKLEYGSIETGFDGAAGVRNLSLIPVGQTQGITIDAVRVRASSWWDLVSLQARLDKGALPQALGFEISGMRVDLGNAALQQLAVETIASQTLAAGASGSSWMLGCEAAEGLNGLQLMHKLGYQQLVLDFSADYVFDRSYKLLTLTLDQSVADQFDMGLSVTLDLGINEFNRYNLTLASPSLGDVKLQYLDRTFNKRYIQFCATAAAESAEQFVERHVGLVAATARARGLVLSESLLEAYRKFLLGAGELQLALLSDSQLWPTSILQFSPEQLFEVLAPELTVNGAQVEPLSILWQPVEGSAEPFQEQVRSQVEAFTALLQAPFMEPAPEVLASVNQPRLPQPAQVLQVLGYHATALDQLQPYIDTKVRIETKNGNLIEGRLLSVGASKLRIYQEVGMGDAILPIVFKHIAAVRVYR